MGIGWSTIVNFTAVTTVLRERGDPGGTINACLLFMFVHLSHVYLTSLFTHF